MVNIWVVLWVDSRIHPVIFVPTGKDRAINGDVGIIISRKGNACKAESS